MIWADINLEHEIPQPKYCWFDGGASRVKRHQQSFIMGHSITMEFVQLMKTTTPHSTLCSPQWTNVSLVCLLFNCFAVTSNGNCLFFFHFNVIHWFLILMHFEIDNFIVCSSQRVGWVLLLPIWNWTNVALVCYLFNYFVVTSNGMIFFQCCWISCAIRYFYLKSLTW